MVFSAIVVTSALKGALGLVGTSLWLIPLLIAGLSYYRYDQLDPESRPINRYPLYAEYDFIVVGGGSAGAVVASRISEIPDWNVLLLEAGPDENEITDVPSLAAYLQLTKLDWKYKTEPTGRACLAMKGGRCNWPRGKVLGGSSVLNYMLYVRGNRHDYDHWEALGNPGWGFSQALYYFKKSEDNRNPYLQKSPYHSTGGYLTVQESPWKTPLVVAFVQAGVEMGYENRDINGERQTGFMIAQGTIRRGSRCSTAKAFLRPVRLRRNIHTAMNAHVTRVLIDPVTMRATGVEFIRDGRRQIVRARKEVILSAGAINSAQILMLSGIGPREHLQEMGIPVIKDLRVGDNLQDHVGMGGLTFLVDKPVSIVQNRFQAAPITMHYVANGRGPMTTLGGVEGYAFVNTKFANRSIDYPDIQFHMAPASINSDAGVQVRRVLGLTDEVYDAVYKPIADKDAWTIMPLLLRPRSRGTVRLRSSNPFHSPLIDANYFADPRDIATLVEGAKLAMKVSEAKVFRQFGSRVHRVNLPGCKQFKFASDAYWDCHIRHISMTIYHPVGTTKMGPPTDPTAVVDPRLRVYGIGGLRVIDASIMPTISSGNTNAPVIMIGEKGADLVKGDWLMNYETAR
ncbi:glucose dehydrogenase [FAD, quinone]-like [Augochlora pura]